MNGMSINRFTPVALIKKDPDLTPRYKFEEFIQREMG
jgi:hypothetical protein